MAISLDHHSASKVLLSAFHSKDIIQKSEQRDKVEMVLRASHKTYKYILVTGLLAKATNEKINPLALQAGANLEGAYDARSLCHKVIVPLERRLLKNVLGGSNEPFLNKPARFTSLSKDNAVRKGNDRTILFTLIDLFTDLSKDDANSLLIHALSVLKKNIDALEDLYSTPSFESKKLTSIYNFLTTYLSQSFEGATLVITVATLEKLLFGQINGEYRVVAHKVNQSGASSKEIGDIDIYLSKEYLYSIEVKDKNFTNYDVQHAFDKMIQHGAVKGYFVFGRNLDFEHQETYDRIMKYLDSGFFCTITGIVQYLNTALIRLVDIDSDTLLTKMSDVTKEINADDKLFHWLSESSKSVDWT